MSESNGTTTKAPEWPSNVLHLILDRGELFRSMARDREEYAEVEAAYATARANRTAAQKVLDDRRRARFAAIEAIEVKLKAAIVAEAKRLGQVPQSIILSGYDTAFMVESDGDLTEYQQVNAIKVAIPATPEATPDEFPEPDDDEDDDFDWDPEDRVGLVEPIARAVTDAELEESAAYEAISDLIGVDAAEAWRSLNTPLNGNAAAQGRPVADAVTDLTPDEDGFVPASALGAMRDAAMTAAAAAQGFNVMDNEIG